MKNQTGRVHVCLFLNSFMFVIFFYFKRDPRAVASAATSVIDMIDKVQLAGKKKQT